MNKTNVVAYRCFIRHFVNKGKAVFSIKLARSQSI